MDPQQSGCGGNTCRGSGTALNKPAVRQKPSGIRLRSALTDDVPDIAQIWQKSILQVCMPYYPECPDWVQQWADSKTPEAVAQLLAAEEFFVVAELHKKICGFFCCSFQLGTFALFVNPDHLHAGIGKRLFSCYQRIAMECGIKQLSFDSSRNAVAFYEKCGCHQIRRSATDENSV